MAKSCIICGGDEDSGEVLLEAPCQRHWVCTDDIASFFERATENESLYPPKCCSQLFLLDVYEAHVPFEVSWAFQKKAQGEYSVLAKYRVYCANPACSKFLSPTTHVKDPATSTSYAICQDDACGKLTCTTCKTLMDGVDSHTCEQNDDYRKFRQMATEKGFQECPTCASTVELAEACNHITCECGAQFCYICGAEWKGMHGCPHYGPAVYDEEGYNQDGFHRTTGLNREGRTRREQARIDHEDDDESDDEHGEEDEDIDEFHRVLQHVDPGVRAVFHTLPFQERELFLINLQIQLHEEQGITFADSEDGDGEEDDEGADNEPDNDNEQRDDGPDQADEGAEENAGGQNNDVDQGDDNATESTMTGITEDVVRSHHVVSMAEAMRTIGSSHADNDVSSGAPALGSDNGEYLAERILEEFGDDDMTFPGTPTPTRTFDLEGSAGAESMRSTTHIPEVSTNSIGTTSAPVMRNAEDAANSASLELSIAHYLMHLSRAFVGVATADFGVNQNTDIDSNITAVNRLMSSAELTDTLQRVRMDMYDETVSHTVIRGALEILQARFPANGDITLLQRSLSFLTGNDQNKDEELSSSEASADEHRPSTPMDVDSVNEQKVEEREAWMGPPGGWPTDEEL